MMKKNYYDQSIYRSPTSWWRPWLWGIALPLTTATQLRFGGAVGVGELLILFMVIEAFLVLIIRGRFEIPTHLSVFTVFLLVAMVALALGTGFAMATDHFLWEGSKHDTQAFLFSWCAIWLLFARMHPMDIYRIYRIHVLVGVGALVLMALAPRGTSFGPIVPWLDGARFQGWALNPNQIAVYCSCIVYLNWGFFWISDNSIERIFFAITAVGAVILGYFSLSEALYLGWIIGFGLGLLLDSFSKGMDDKAKKWSRRIAIIITLGGITLLLVRFNSVVFSLINYATNTYNTRNQGDIRVTLWTNGLKAIAQSPLFGFGPGPHSGYGGPHTHHESHNTLIDWGASTGLMGLGVYLYFLYHVAMWCIRSGRGWLLAAFISIQIYSVLHYVVRQPTYWLYMLFLIMLGQAYYTSNQTKQQTGTSIS